MIALAAVFERCTAGAMARRVRLGQAVRYLTYYMTRSSLCMRRQQGGLLHAIYSLSTGCEYYFEYDMCGA